MDSGNTRRTFPWFQSKTALLVVKAELVPGPDKFTLYVNPDLELPEPTEGTVKNDLDIAFLGGLGISASGAFLLDEIRYGESYADVLPTTGVISLTGDFDQSGVLDAIDIDLLSAEVRGSASDMSYDLNSDTQINQEDRRVWVEDLRQTFFGDVTLDGKVEFDDFVAVSNNFNQTGGWANGDTSGNGIVDFDDFVQLSIRFGESATFTSVPEPVSELPVMLLAAICLMHFNRR